MSGIVICGFPGTGKSYCFKNFNSYCCRITDSDSSEYHWCHSNDGTKTPHPDWPANYIARIKYLMDTEDVIFVSSHQEIRDALKEAGIRYVLVYPNNELKESYIHRYETRGSDKSFVQMMNAKWSDFIDSCENDEYAKIKLILNDSTIGLSPELITILSTFYNTSTHMMRAEKGYFMIVRK